MEKIKLIADSSCELNETICRSLSTVSVPLTMTIGDDHFVDDGHMDMPVFLDKLAHLRTAAKSACPSPHDFLQHCQKGDRVFFLTLSSKLSGSYQSAVVAAQEAEEMGVEACALDSQSASAGETCIAMKLAELAEQGLSFGEIREQIQKFIGQMRTFFCLEHLDVFIHNGRINKLIGKLAGVLNIRLILGDDGSGSIALFDKGRGEAQSMQKLLSAAEKHAEAPEKKDLVISYCACRERAEQLAQAIREKIPFRRIQLMETAGLSSLYANAGGIILAF